MMKQKKFKYLGVLCALGMSICAFMGEAAATTIQTFPWANAGHYAPYNNSAGYLKGGPQLGGTGSPTYISEIYGTANPIWNEAEIFEPGYSWYDCLDGDYSWKLIITNLSGQDDAILLRVYTPSGAQADINTLIVDNTNNKKLINTAPNLPYYVQWIGTPANEFWFQIPAGETRIISSRDIFEQSVFGANPTDFGHMPVTLQIESDYEMDAMLVGELNSRPRVESGTGSTGTEVSVPVADLFVKRHQWATVQYEGFSDQDNVVGEDYIMLPYFRTANDTSTDHIGFATAVLLENTTDYQQDLHTVAR